MIRKFSSLPKIWCLWEADVVQVSQLPVVILQLTYMKVVVLLFISLLRWIVVLYYKEYALLQLVFHLKDYAVKCYHLMSGMQSLAGGLDVLMVDMNCYQSSRKLVTLRLFMID